MSTTTREVETKLAVPGLFALPDLSAPEAGVGRDAVQPAAVLRATYWDAPDLRLAREGITLRHRTGEGAPTWTLKLPAGRHATGLDREELGVEAGADVVPAELADLLIARLRGAPLEPVAVIETERTRHLLEDSDGVVLVDVVDDLVSLLDGEKIVQRFREIEVEERDGGQAAATATIQGLVQAGAVVADQTPKLVRALGPRALEPGELPRPAAVRRTSPAGDLVRRALRDGLHRLVASDVGVRREDHDAVHQMRVACRRLRSDLRTFRTLVDDPRAELLREELAWLADSLGASRDLEVLRARLRRTAVLDPLAPIDDLRVEAVDGLLAEDENDGRTTVLAALRSARYVALLQLLVEVAREPGLTDLAAGRCRDVLPGLVGATWTHLAKRARRLKPEDPDAAWHRARILAKRTRYAAEAVEPVLGKRAARLARAAEAVQEVLGEHQDAAVAAERVLLLPDRRPRDRGFAVVCGRLAERERTQVHRARDSFGPVWRRADQASVAGWLP